MESSTTIKSMLSGTRIIVPSYQRAFSWDVGSQVNVFLSDLEDYIGSTSVSSYYFGHFLFEHLPADPSIPLAPYAVIDGQQRLTTIVIFLSSLFSRLTSLRFLTEVEKVSWEDMIKRSTSLYHFKTVEYDNSFFWDYVIDGSRVDVTGLETESSKRIAKAFNYFTDQLKDKDEAYLLKMLNAIRSASCTTHIVSNESEAIQMFIFQNNRGKHPSKLEILKAEFMYIIHLSGGVRKDALISEIKERFEKIYKSISKIEYNLSEDEILNHTLRVYFNSLSKDSTDLIYKELSDTSKDPLDFICSFTQSLTRSFEYLTIFFGKDERAHMEIHSLVTLGGLKLALPFIIKAYSFGLPKAELCSLCSSLESLVLRHRLIGTKAILTSRINDVYQGFTLENRSIVPIVDRINRIKNVSSDSWWWAYWNNTALRSALEGEIDHRLVRFLLWKYENYLISKAESKGYSLSLRFDAERIRDPAVEHISPVTPSVNPVASGYSVYDEEFTTQYLNCLGNYLLISGSHNSSISNDSFPVKYTTYTYLEQQKEVRSMSEPCGITWTKDLIRARKEKIITFIESHV
jgi:hypothetical protein